MTVDVTAAICTHNRAAYLGKALESLLTQTLDASRYEVLVVDNASTDDTKRVAEAARRRAPNVRYVHVPELGVSHARNASWLEARAPFVAYLDDDAIAHPDWLERALHAFDNTRPEPGAVGGKIEPIWEKARPPWLSDALARALTVVDWSEDPCPVEPDQWLVAANLVIPRRVLEEIGGFRTDLGRRGNQLLSNEENLVRLEIEANGYVCWYDPRMVVRHHMHESRVSKRWFRTRLYWQGVSDARMRKHLTDHSRAWWVYRGARSLLRLSVSPSFVRNLLVPVDEPEAFDRQCDAWYKLGYGLGRMNLVGRS